MILTLIKKNVGRILLWTLCLVVMHLILQQTTTHTQYMKRPRYFLLRAHGEVNLHHLWHPSCLDNTLTSYSTSKPCSSYPCVPTNGVTIRSVIATSMFRSTTGNSTYQVNNAGNWSHICKHGKISGKLKCLQESDMSQRQAGAPDQRTSYRTHCWLHLRSQPIPPG